MKSGASLDTTAKIISAFVLVLALVLTVTGLRERGNSSWWGSLLAFGIIDTILIVCLLYATRSYEIKDGKLIVKRWINNKTYDLKKLQHVKPYKEIKNGFSVRTFGNGGAFGYWGWFYNNGFGKYFMLATSMKNLLILNFTDQRIGISPDNKTLKKNLKSISPDHIQL